MFFGSESNGLFSQTVWSCRFFLKGIDHSNESLHFIHRGARDCWLSTNNHNTVEESRKSQSKALFSEAGRVSNNAGTTTCRAIVFCSFCSNEAAASVTQHDSASKHTRIAPRDSSQTLVPNHWRDWIECGLNASPAKPALCEWSGLLGSEPNVNVVLGDGMWTCQCESLCELGSWS